MHGAAYDSKERDPPPRCHPGTRIELLDDLTTWFDAGAEEECGKILWLHGPAGTGKSAIAQTVCEHHAQRNDLAASFFFSRGRPGRDTGTYLFTTIVYQLALSIPEFRKKVIPTIDHDPQIIHRATSLEIAKLLVEPFVCMASDTNPNTVTPLHKTPTLVVIDGLDECQGDESQTFILKTVLRIIQHPAVPLRFLILSRPEHPIRHGIERTALKGETTIVSLYGKYLSHKDVRTYLHAEFHRIRNSPKHEITMSDEDDSWPGTKVTDIVAHAADGYFIFASTLIKFVDDKFDSPATHLERLLEEDFTGSEPFAALDKLYIQILSTNPNSDHLNLILGHFFAHSGFRRNNFLWCLDSHAAAIGLKANIIELHLHALQSIIVIDYNEAHYSICFIHKSFEDFICDPSRAGKWLLDPIGTSDRLYQNVYAQVTSAQSENAYLPYVGHFPRTPN